MDSLKYYIVGVIHQYFNALADTSSSCTCVVHFALNIIVPMSIRDGKRFAM